MNKSPTARLPASLLIPFVLPVRCKGAGVCLQLLAGGSSRGGEVSGRIKDIQDKGMELGPVCSFPIPAEQHRPCREQGRFLLTKSPSCPPLSLPVQGTGAETCVTAPCALLLRGLGWPINPDGILGSLFLLWLFLSRFLGLDHLCQSVCLITLHVFLREFNGVWEFS